MIITCLAASSAPGVSTTALMLTTSAPSDQNSLLVEADPVGSSPTLAGYLQGQVRHDKSLVNLVDPHLRGQLEHTFSDQLVPLNAAGKAHVLPGIVHARQNTTTRGIWTALADHLGGLSTDGMNIVIDGGRIGAQGFPRELVERSDLILLVQRPTRVAVAASASALPTLRAQLEQSRSKAPVGLAVVGREPYGPKEVGRVLNIPVALTIPHDQRGARVFSEGIHLTGFSRVRSALLRDLTKLWPTMTTFTEKNRPDWLSS